MRRWQEHRLLCAEGARWLSTVADNQYPLGLWTLYMLFYRCAVLPLLKRVFSFPLAPLSEMDSGVDLVNDKCEKVFYHDNQA